MKRILLILCASCGSTCAGANEVFVTAESFARVVADATPGQTLVLTDGVYRDVKWNFRAKGESDRPVLLRARTLGRVFLMGGSELTVSGEHLIVSGLVFDQAWGKKVVELSRAQHCRLTDCAFVSCGNPDSTFSHVVYLVNGSAWNRVDHCHFEGSLSMSLGVRIHEDDPSNPHNRFDHNYFKDILRRSSNGQEAIQIGQNKFSARQLMHTLVESNLFDNASGDGEIVCNKSCGNVIRGNTFVNCRGSAIRIGRHSHSDPDATQVPFANVFVNNILSGNTGELVQFDAPNNQLWRATSVWAQGQAKPGVQPRGVEVERVAVLQAQRVAKFQADIAPILAAMLYPCSFDQACPTTLEARELEPREVGPVWMHGDPRQVTRVGERKAVPDLRDPRPRKKT